MKGTSRLYRSGYEVYRKPGSIPDLQVDHSLWMPDAVPQNESRSGPVNVQPFHSGAPQKKMMSLEEVEASLQPQPKRGSGGFTIRPLSQEASSFNGDKHEPPQGSRVPRVQPSNRLASPQPYNLPEAKPQQNSLGHSHSSQFSRGSFRDEQFDLKHNRSDKIAAETLRPKSSPSHPANIAVGDHNPPRLKDEIIRPTRVIAPSNSASLAARPVPSVKSERQVHLPIITHPSQLASLTEAQRQALVSEEAKRAKRNHKIYLLSKGNGLMTPQDKNFITRIQLQHLMTATGNVHEENPASSLLEDFYYQVYNQIENRPQHRSQQPFSKFAHAYLHQIGTRRGTNNRRPIRGDHHVHRMQQQVQRAVEAAKAKPKNKQLVIEGSLGKISFSNAKTPKPLLNIARNEKRQTVSLNTADCKAILKNIEAVYSCLMAIEDHDRHMPPNQETYDDPKKLEQVTAWRRTFQELNQNLWSALKVMEPIVPDSPVMHPFIAFLSYPKGKKAVPRIHPHIDQEQRLTILTILIVQLDTLDVIQDAHTEDRPIDNGPTAEEQIDLFLQMVMPSLFSYVTGAPLSVVIGLVGLVIERVNIALLVCSRIGLEILTMLLSQAEIIRKSETINEPEWDQWLGIYHRLFDVVEPLLSNLVPSTTSSGQASYIWHFLATLGSGANPEQQQRLVLAVK